MVVFAIVSGMLIGLMFHYIQKDYVRRMPFNMGMGMVGGLLGYGLALIIPMLPDYREGASALIIMVVAVHFMGLSWMISKRRRPVVRHVEKTHLGETHFGR